MSYQGHVLMEHRSGLVVGAAVTHADGMGERLAALRMLDTVPGTHPKTVAAIRLRHPRLRRGVPPAPRDAPWRAIARAAAAAPSMVEPHDIQAMRSVKLSEKRIEEHFGWGKTIGRIRQTVYRGIKRVDQHFKLTMTASNIVRMVRMFSAVPRGAGR